MAKKRYKLKKKIKIIIIFIIVLLGAFYLYKDLTYKATYEYKLTKIGYSLKEVKLLKDNFDNEKLGYLVSLEEKDDTLVELIQNKFYKKENYNRYMDYINKNKYSVDKTVNDVNVNLDYYFYDLKLDADINKNHLILVNKYYLLPSSYEPENLVNISNDYAWQNTNKLNKDAFDSFKIMHNAAKDEGIYLMINSAYRSYNNQEEVYNYYTTKYDQKYADKIAARPGASEHQTGLAIDVFSMKDRVMKSFSSSPTYSWLKDNSYKYGFILRYPEGKENITGYDFESWHYRYIGVHHANKLYKLNITFDEYYANYLS